MFVTMKEYFAAKDMNFENMELLSKSPTGFYENVVFYAGITARMMKGHQRSKSCVWFPEEAKLVNKLLGGQVLNRHSAHNLMRENNNNNVLIFERFGDVSVMWTIPIIEKIVNNAMEALDGQFKAFSYVGHSLMFSLTNKGNIEAMIDNNVFPSLESFKDSSDTQRDWLKNFFSYFELTLGSFFPKLLFNGLGYNFVGYGDGDIYLRNECDELICFSYFRDERLVPLLKPITVASTVVIDQCILEGAETPFDLPIN